MATIFQIVAIAAILQKPEQIKIINNSKALDI